MSLARPVAARRDSPEPDEQDQRDQIVWAVDRNLSSLTRQDS